MRQRRTQDWILKFLQNWALSPPNLPALCWLFSLPQPQCLPTSLPHPPSQSPVWDPLNASVLPSWASSRSTRSAWWNDHNWNINYHHFVLEPLTHRPTSMHNLQVPQISQRLDVQTCFLPRILNLGKWHYCPPQSPNLEPQEPPDMLLLPLLLQPAVNLFLNLSLIHPLLSSLPLNVILWVQAPIISCLNHTSACKLVSLPSVSSLYPLKLSCPATPNLSSNTPVTPELLAFPHVFSPLQLQLHEVFHLHNLYVPLLGTLSLLRINPLNVSPQTSPPPGTSFWYPPQSQIPHLYAGIQIVYCPKKYLEHMKFLFISKWMRGRGGGYLLLKTI